MRCFAKGGSLCHYLLVDFSWHYPQGQHFFPSLWSSMFFLFAQPWLTQTFRSKDAGEQGLWNVRCPFQPLGSWHSQHWSKDLLLYLHTGAFGEGQTYKEKRRRGMHSWFWKIYLGSKANLNIIKKTAKGERRWQLVISSLPPPLACISTQSHFPSGLITFLLSCLLPTCVVMVPPDLYVELRFWEVVWLGSHSCSAVQLIFPGCSSSRWWSGLKEPERMGHVRAHLGLDLGPSGHADVRYMTMKLPFLETEWILTTLPPDWCRHSVRI